MKQLVQLQAIKQGFDRAGLSLVAMTYDAPRLQSQFIQKDAIEFPLLSDRGAQSVRSLGILNEDYTPGDDHYGIPYPGIFVLDQRLHVRGKLFLEPYEQRIDGAEVLKFAKVVLAHRSTELD
ncbi:MAG: redoxin domain-containing protein [Pseudomonadales bacterium]